MASPKERVTGVVYDDRLSSHFNAWNQDFTERPRRTIQCVQRCKEMGLLDRCKHISVREATEEEMLTGHTPQHISLLKGTETMSKDELMLISQKYDYIYFHQKSFENAKLALGGVIDLVDEIASGKITNGMAIVRPPGHHAMKEEFCGYCYLGNVSIAAELMLNKYKMKRILILDWDVHHGQGSQFAFYDDPRVLFVSIHRYELGSEWPHLRDSDYDFIGEGPGKGFTINVPLNETGCGNDDYLAIFFNLLMPIFYEFDPELVLVSAGYDSAIGCPEGEMKVTPACFAHFVNMLTPLASGKLALILEGGYNLKSLAESAALSLRAILGDPTPSIAPISRPRNSVVESVLNAIKVLHPYWQSLRYQDLVEGKDLIVENYPYHRVLHLPPVKDVKFYTSENRPEWFPLLQECANVEAIEEMADINRVIDGLIQKTNLNFPKTRLSVCCDEGSSELCHDLKSRGLWPRCLSLQESFSETLSAPNCVRASADSILGVQAQCSLSLVQSSSTQQNGTANGSSDTHTTNIDVAVQHVLDGHNANKILVVELGGSQPSVQTITTMDSRVHCISLTWNIDRNDSSAQPNAAKNSSDRNKTGGNSNLVSIDLKTDVVTDSDLLAAFYQIVLQLSYEICPELVIFTWRQDVFSEKECLQLSPACFGHLTQLLRGLAQGRLFLLVETDKDKTDSKGSDVLAECVSVILGENCNPVNKGVPSESTISTIKKLQDTLKDKWEIFQFRQQIPKVNI